MTDKRITNVKLVFAVCFLALMTALGASTVFTGLEKALVREKFRAEIGVDVPIVKSFQKSYPFDKAAEKETFKTPAASEKMKNFSIYSSAVQNVKRNVNKCLTYENSLFAPFYRLINRLDEITGNNLIQNGSNPIVRLPDGYFTYIFSYNDSSDSWENIRDQALWLKKRDIPLLQIIPAAKMDDSITVFPPGIPREYARTIEQYKTFLDQNKIPYFDAKNVLLAQNADFYSWFYKTDHHWNVFAGRTIAEAAAQKLNDDFGIQTDVSAVQKENFTLTRYPSFFLGGMAVKAGAEPEDLDIFYPRNENCFHIKIPSLGIDRTGGFNDTLIAQPYLNQHKAYMAFLYGDPPLVQIENKNCANGAKVLVIKHSMADVVCPYLARAVQYLDMIDPRYFDGNIKAYIKQTKPHIVLVCI